jgi:hypothetical protein
MKFLKYIKPGVYEAIDDNGNLYHIDEKSGNARRIPAEPDAGVPSGREEDLRPSTDEPKHQLGEKTLSLTDDQGNLYTDEGLDFNSGEQVNLDLMQAIHGDGRGGTTFGSAEFQGVEHMPEGPGATTGMSDLAGLLGLAALFAGKGKNLISRSAGHIKGGFQALAGGKAMQKGSSQKDIDFATILGIGRRGEGKALPRNRPSPGSAKDKLFLENLRRDISRREARSKILDPTGKPVQQYRFAKAERQRLQELEGLLDPRWRPPQDAIKPRKFDAPMLDKSGLDRIGKQVEQLRNRPQWVEKSFDKPWSPPPGGGGKPIDPKIFERLRPGQRIGPSSRDMDRKVWEFMSGYYGTKNKGLQSLEEQLQSRPDATSVKLPTIPIPEKRSY